jgi:selenocysteine-specific elongation factor
MRSMRRASTRRGQGDRCAAGRHGDCERSPLFALSAKTGEGIAALRAHLDATAVAHRTRSTGLRGRFRLAIDRCFSLAGIGTVVTGTAHAGKVGAGDTVIITPSGR